jgi:hypothetical protein
LIVALNYAILHISRSLPISIFLTTPSWLQRPAAAIDHPSHPKPPLHPRLDHLGQLHIKFGGEQTILSWSKATVLSQIQFQCLPLSSATKLNKLEPIFHLAGTTRVILAKKAGLTTFSFGLIMAHTSQNSLAMRWK